MSKILKFGTEIVVTCNCVLRRKKNAFLDALAHLHSQKESVQGEEFRTMLSSATLSLAA